MILKANRIIRANALQLSITWRLTNWKFEYTLNTKTEINAKIKSVEIVPVFYTLKSWVKSEQLGSEKISQDLLKHEQGHFDLAEECAKISTKQLNAIIKNKQISVNANSPQERNKLFLEKRRQITNESFNALLNYHMKIIQELYDIETDRGKNLEIQNEYNSRFKKLRL